MEAARNRHSDHAQSGAFLKLPRLFLDCDGVLADFDKAAARLFGMPADKFQARHGNREFWKRIQRAPDFYGSLPKMADADELFDAVKHLSPTILTGLPLGNWAAPQKVRWAAEHFPGVPIITCMARDKHRHMHDGDLLVDDRETHRATYESAGMIFIHHTSAKSSLRELAAIFPSVEVPA